MALAGTHNRTHQTAVFLCDERPHIAGSLVEVGHRHLLPYTYNFQDNGGALGEVTVTNTGAPTESWAGCYMSDCANNHAESSRVCGAGGRWAAGVAGGGKRQSEWEREREREEVYECVNKTGRSWGGGQQACVEKWLTGPGKSFFISLSSISHFLPSDELLLNDCHFGRCCDMFCCSARNWEGVTSACFSVWPFLNSAAQGIGQSLRLNYFSSASALHLKCWHLAPVHGKEAPCSRFSASGTEHRLAQFASRS